MATQTVRQVAEEVTGYLAAIEHLPEGSTLIVPAVAPEEYEQLVAKLGDSGALRVGYFQGRLEIMSPSSIHEAFKELLIKLVYIVEAETGLIVESLGSTTFRKGTFPGGAEPDTCFYVQNAPRIIGKSKIDLRRDPPPDVVVEIDLASSSTAKRAFYAHIGVPEFWRYDGQRLHILRLSEAGYVEISNSLSFPVLTAARLTQALQQSRTKGQSVALRAFRQWLRKKLAAND